MKDLRNIHKQGEFWKDEWCKKCVMGTCVLTNQMY